MNEPKPTYVTPPTKSLKMLQAMVGIGIICALLIVLTFEYTLPIIKKNRAEALEKAIFKVLPGIVKKETFMLDENQTFALPNTEVKDNPLVYAGYNDQDDLVGYAIEASGIGFADIIRILYGYDPNKGKIIGFYVLESKETPGLGDKIEKDETFLDNFKALDVSLNSGLKELNNIVYTVKSGAKENPWEIDGITGATISSRAIGNIIAESSQNWIPLIYTNKEQLEELTIEKPQE
jgi:electron transport complex protein RnfG